VTNTFKNNILKDESVEHNLGTGNIEYFNIILFVTEESSLRLHK
jgi:hypothetical protein